MIIIYIDDYIYIFTMFAKLVSSEVSGIIVLFTMFDELVSSEWVNCIIYNPWLISE